MSKKQLLNQLYDKDLVIERYEILDNTTNRLLQQCLQLTEIYKKMLYDSAEHLMDNSLSEESKNEMGLLILKILEKKEGNK
ncbi:MAG: hypothetical protein R3Y63_11250 [Eubacteriales bacterium]